MRPPPGTPGARPLENWLGESTTLMLDAAGITTGSTVLDIAAGAGGQSLAAARRVGPTGHVLATDISPAILDHAAAAAAAEGLTNVATRELDGERLDVDPASFDAVISRLGLIYFPDQPARPRRPVPRAAARWPDRGHRLLHRGPQRLLLRPGVDHPAARAAATSRTRTARTVQPRRPWRAHRRLPGGGVPRRRLPGRASRAADAARAGLRPVRAGVLRRVAPDAERSRTRRSGSRPGRRSAPSWHGSRAPRASRAPAS